MLAETGLRAREILQEVQGAIFEGDGRHEPFNVGRRPVGA
jgi:hypothetical protein